MLKSLRQAGLKVIVALLRVFTQAAPGGWRPSDRKSTLIGK